MGAALPAVFHPAVLPIPTVGSCYCMDVMKGEEYLDPKHNPPPTSGPSKPIPTKTFEHAVTRNELPSRRDQPAVAEERHLALQNGKWSYVTTVLEYASDPHLWQPEPYGEGSRSLKDPNRRKGNVKEGTVVNTDGDGETTAKEVAHAMFMGWPNLGGTFGAGNASSTAESQGRMVEHLEDLRRRSENDDSPFMSARRMFYDN